MQWNEAAIQVVRDVADELWESNEETIMPGWDPDHLDERDVAIRTAAMAVLGPSPADLPAARLRQAGAGAMAREGGSLDPDNGVRVTERALGALLRYIVDMLEP